MKRINWAIIGVLVSGLLLSQQALAQRFPERWKGPNDRKQQIESPDRSRSLDNAVNRIRKETNSRVLSAETRSVDGRRVHVIRVLTEDGRVKRLRVDADNDRRKRR